MARTGRSAGRALEDVLDIMRRAREARSAGTSGADVARHALEAGGRATRLAATEAFHDYERAITAMRAQFVRHLIDEEHWAAADVAALFGVSRQATARLYHGDADDANA